MFCFISGQEANGVMQFVDIGSRECYVGMLYACNDLIRPDVVLEISWRHGLNDFTMVRCLIWQLDLDWSWLTLPQPFMINMLSRQHAAIEELKKDNEERKAREASQQKDEDNTPILGGGRLLLTQGPVNSGPSPSPGPYGRPNGVGYNGGF